MGAGTMIWIFYCKSSLANPETSRSQPITGANSRCPLFPFGLEVGSETLAYTVPGRLCPNLRYPTYILLYNPMASQVGHSPPQSHSRLVKRVQQFCAQAWLGHLPPPKQQLCTPGITLPFPCLLNADLLLNETVGKIPI